MTTTPRRGDPALARPHLVCYRCGANPMKRRVIGERYGLRHIIWDCTKCPSRSEYLVGLSTSQERALIKADTA